MDPLLQSVADYYTDKVDRHGASPRGADWNGAEGQRLRFTQLLKVARDTTAFSLDDYGCGYGALLDFVREDARQIDYLGIDVSTAMIQAAQAHHPGEDARCREGPRSPRAADYAVASGIFNVRLTVPLDEWERHVIATLDALQAGSRKGFAFNCLTTYSDPPFRKDYLYYADPAFYFNLCMTRYGRQVTLIHDYGLYEFTLLVSRPVQS